MKKPDNKRDRGRGFSPDEDEFGPSRTKAVKSAKPQKRIRLQDLDFEEE